MKVFDKFAQPQNCESVASVQALRSLASITSSPAYGEMVFVWQKLRGSWFSLFVSASFVGVVAVVGMGVVHLRVRLALAHRQSKSMMTTIEPWI